MSFCPIIVSKLWGQGSWPGFMSLPQIYLGEVEKRLPSKDNPHTVGG